LQQVHRGPVEKSKASILSIGRAGSWDAVTGMSARKVTIR
jgi:hypothetical protein